MNEEKDATLGAYLSEIDSIQKRFGRPEQTGAPNQANEPRDEIDRIVEGFSKRPLDESDDLSASTKKRRLEQSDMPWFTPDLLEEYPLRPSCKKTIDTLESFSRSEDLTRAKFLVNTSPNAPIGVPSSQWDKIFRGETVSLDHFFSSMHSITIDEERKGHVGETSISLGSIEAKKKVQSSADWAAAWEVAYEAISFVFPHRARELRDYGTYIRQELAAKQVGAHHDIFRYDLAVRTKVRGGQRILLSDLHEFSNLYSAFLLPSGIENFGRERKGGNKPTNQTRNQVCNKFNSQDGCSFPNCRHRHICKSCERKGHGQHECDDKN
ncbi:hypothetical protein CPB83DRAFT_778860 [Crepidotus variabilis]|uniref:C3H1-type domain-containing protein n=1 Tax=Crepidotus variabilis TaxID=179855 RepID=A0A9P6E2U3_9AGAR|nr:hypothetical protein CPB83DRAFT_778860 [Crepidotus variabilis]